MVRNIGLGFRPTGTYLAFCNIRKVTHYFSCVSSTYLAFTGLNKYTRTEHHGLLPLITVFSIRFRTV